MSRAGRNRQELALAFFDLDHFKTINDRFGHEAGDALLREFGGILSSQGPPVDVVPRLGGDEFAALLPPTPLHGALTFAERVRTVVAHHTVPYGANALTTTVSVRAALLPEA